MNNNKIIHSSHSHCANLICNFLSTKSHTLTYTGSWGTYTLLWTDQSFGNNNNCANTRTVTADWYINHCLPVVLENLQNQEARSYAPAHSRTYE